MTSRWCVSARAVSTKNMYTTQAVLGIYSIDVKISVWGQIYKLNTRLAAILTESKTKWLNIWEWNSNLFIA